MATDTTKLITDLEHMDEDEARIHGRLLKELEELEQDELRKRSLTVADMEVLQTAIDELQARIAGARTAAAAPALTPIFEQLEAQVREHDATAQRVRELLAERLQRLAPPAPEDDGHNHDSESGPRLKTFRIRRTPMRGADVLAFQRVLNHRYEVWGIRRQIAQNGVYGAETREAAHQIALGLGLLKFDYADGITPLLRILIRNPEKRTALQKKRFASAERRRYRAALRSATRRRRASPGHRSTAMHTATQAPAAARSAAAGSLRRSAGTVAAGRKRSSPRPATSTFRCHWSAP